MKSEGTETPSRLEPAMDVADARQFLDSFCHNTLVLFKTIIDEKLADGSSMNGDRAIEERDKEMGLGE